jgi:hypothetical protein
MTTYFCIKRPLKLAEGEGSVQLTSSLRQVVLEKKAKNIYNKKKLI